jgi:hypothetical protein
VLYNKVLSSEEAGETALYFEVESHWSLALLNLLYDKGGAVATPFKLF